jgi:hypothetical protein
VHCKGVVKRDTLEEDEEVEGGKMIKRFVFEGNNLTVVLARKMEIKDE